MKGLLLLLLFLALALGGCAESNHQGGSPPPQREAKAPEEDSGAPTPAECARFREYGVGNDYCETVERAEVRRGFQRAAKEEARERREHPSGKTKWEELAE